MNHKIRHHPDSNTFIIKRKAFFEDNISFDGNVIAGPGANFWKNVKTTGRLELAKGSVIGGSVKADHAIIGPRSVIKGNVDVTTDLTIMDNTTVYGNVNCGGQLSIRPGCRLDSAKAGISIVLIGQVLVRDLTECTRVVVRSDE
jgi:cytoskeletal protein CcmA (bactofilin family)